MKYFIYLIFTLTIFLCCYCDSKETTIETDFFNDLELILLDEEKEEILLCRRDLDCLMIFLINSNNNDINIKFNNVPVEILRKVDRQTESNIYSKRILFIAFCYYLHNGKFDYLEIYKELEALQDYDPERFNYLFYGKGR